MTKLLAGYCFGLPLAGQTLGEISGRASSSMQPSAAGNGRHCDAAKRRAATLSIGGLDNSQTTPTYDRPNATGAPLYVSNPSPAHWYNPAAFVEAAPGTFGNVGRGTMIVPGTFIVNGEVHKEFNMPRLEKHLLQFRLEAFNMLNHPNWGAPNGNILPDAAIPGQPSTNAHQNFGVITTTA